MPIGIPYARGPYQTPRNSIAALMMERGRLAGQGALNSGAIWADVLGRLGAIPGQIQSQKAADEELRARRDERQARTEQERAQTAKLQAEQETKRAVGGALEGYGSEGFDINKAAAGLPPEARVMALKMHEELEGSRLKTQEMRDQAERRDAFDLARMAAAAEGLLGTEMAEAGLGLISQYASSRFPKQFEQIQAAIKKDPKSLGPLLKGLQQASPEFLKMRAETQNQESLMKERGAVAQDRQADNARQQQQLDATISHQKAQEAQAAAALGETRRHNQAVEGKPTAPQRLTKDERQDMAAWDYALPKLDKFVEYVEKNPEKWGRWDAIKEGLKQATPGFSDADYASQTAFIGRFNAEIRHARFGSNLSEAEKETAKSFLINETDQPAVIVSKVREAAARARANKKYYEDLGFKLPAESGAKNEKKNPFR